MLHNLDELPSELRNALPRFETKSDQIRYLSDAGIARADIARVLELRYQHVRNVLEADRAKASAEAELKGGAMPTSSSVEPVWVDVTRDGKVVLPRAVLDAMGIVGDEKIVLRVECGELRAATAAVSLERIRARLAPLRQSGVSEVDAFLRERRGLWGEE